jgi:hypothetical protein
MTNEFGNHAPMVYVLTLLVTFHRVTTKFDLDPLARWATAALRRDQAIARRPGRR